ncbi:MAG TPA: hypothetical protein PKJ36_00940, partial [Flavihumibacter sp.]|nr:hypothetical protein [Flavihumibacter sp.]
RSGLLELEMGFCERIFSSFDGILFTSDSRNARGERKRLTVVCTLVVFWGLERLESFEADD